MRIIIETEERAASIVQPLVPGVAAAPATTTQAGVTQPAATFAPGLQAIAPSSPTAFDGGAAPRLPSMAVPEAPEATGNGLYAPLESADVSVVNVGAAPRMSTAREVIAQSVPGMVLPPSAPLPNEISAEEHIEPPADRLRLAHDEVVFAAGMPAGSAPEVPKHERSTHAAARRRSARDESR